MSLCVPMISFSQNHSLVILNGAVFNGTGTITVKDSIRNNSSASSTAFPGKMILSGYAQTVLANVSNGSLQFETFSIRGSGTKVITGTVAVTDSLNILPGAIVNMNTDTLRIGNIATNSGSLQTTAGSVIEYNRSNGSVQTIAGGNYSGKIRLLGLSRKSIFGTLAIDSIEHSGWGVTINNNVTVAGRTQIDTLIQVAGGAVLSAGAGTHTISTLQGNGGVIETSSAGNLRFLSDASNGTGTIRTANGTISFLGNVNSAGTLSLTGTGTMTFGGTVTSANYSFSSGSTVMYNGGAQMIAPANYGSLTLSNAGLKTFPAGSTGIAGTISLINGAAADALTNSAVIQYNGTGAQTIGALDYYSLTIMDHGNQQITLHNGGTIRVAGIFSNSVNNTNILNTNNTFEFNGTAAQTVLPFSYYHLIFSGSGEKTIAASQTANGNVLQQSGTPVTVNAGVIWQIDGTLTTQTNFSNNGEIIIGN